MKTFASRTEFADEEVLWRVESYLYSKHFQVFRNLEIHVSKGVVTVAGTVDDFHQRQVALNSCKRVAGVLGLNDRIIVADSAGCQELVPNG